MELRLPQPAPRAAAPATPWFETPREAHTVLFWIPAGERPPLTEAQARLGHLREHGPTPYAFTFKERFPASALV